MNRRSNLQRIGKKLRNVSVDHSSNNSTLCFSFSHSATDSTRQGSEESLQIQ